MRCLNGDILQWGALEKILLHKVGGDKKSLGTYGVDGFRTDLLFIDSKIYLYYTNKILILRRYRLLVISRPIHHKIHTYTLKHTYIMSYAKLNYIIDPRLITFT